MLNAKIEIKNMNEIPKINQNEVSKAFFSFSFSVENLKNEVSNPKVRITLINAIQEYKLENTEKASLSI